MKATEIQLFDWVKIPDKNAPYRRIWAIEYPFDNSVYVDDYGKEDSDDNYSITEIEPIPLTPEILEKNGFNRHGCVSKNEQYQVMIQHWSKDNLALNKVGKHGNPVFIPDLIYVHELQHALRLCGLDDLAENFKV